MCGGSRSFIPLQLVVLEAPPAIQEGPPIDEVFRSDSDEEAAAGVGSRQGVALKLGNAKDVDAKCEVMISDDQSITNLLSH